MTLTEKLADYAIDMNMDIEEAIDGLAAELCDDILAQDDDIKPTSDELKILEFCIADCLSELATEAADLAKVKKQDSADFIAERLEAWRGDY